MPLADYFTGYRQTVRRPGELIRAVRIPLPLAGLTAFHKIAKRRYDDISSVAVGFAIDVVDGEVVRARIGLGGVAATPIRALATEAALEGRPWTRETVDARRPRCCAGEGTPMDDHRASAAYRSAMLGQSLLQALGGQAARCRMSTLSDRPDEPSSAWPCPHESAALHVTGARALHRRPGGPDARRAARPAGPGAARPRAGHPARRRRRRTTSRAWCAC